MGVLPLPRLAMPYYVCHTLGMADHERLQKIAKNRRLSLGLSQTKLADKAGVSPSVVENVEKGHPIWDINLFKLDAAYGWAQGSMQAILEGGEPTDLGDTNPSVRDGEPAKYRQAREEMRAMGFDDKVIESAIQALKDGTRQVEEALKKAKPSTQKGRKRRAG